MKQSLSSSVALIAAVAMLVLTIWLWFNVSSYQSIWPFPALYFIEMAAIGLFGAFWVLRRSPPFYTWITAGVLLGFALIGAWSVGLLYLPFALVFMLVAAVRDMYAHDWRQITAHLAAFVCAAAAQAFLMLAVSRLVF